MKWKRTKSYKIIKDYWEFQQEFESLETAIEQEKQMQEKILEVQNLEKAIKENYEKARSIVWKNYKELWIIP